jgi:hypothetical protein
MRKKIASVNRFWILFALLFLLIAVQGGVGLFVLTDFARSVTDLRTMQGAGMKIDEFGLLLNNFVKEMKVSTGIGQQGLGLVTLPPTAALAQETSALADVNAQIHSEPLTALLSGVRQLDVVMADYSRYLQRGAGDDATLTYIRTIEPLADRLLSSDFPATRSAVLADVARVSEANRRSGIFARRVLITSLVATLAVGLLLGRLIWLSLWKVSTQERELERRASELAIAHSIQTSVLPRDLRLPGFDVGAVMLTAEEVGGDFYEFRPVSDGGAWIAVGDVTGHGLSSGLVMLMAQSMFSMLSGERGDPSPKQLLARLNKSLFFNLRERLHEDKYMTMVVARVFPDGRMVYAGAHTDLLVYRRDEHRVERMPTEGLWLGLVEDMDGANDDHEVRLRTGDMALFHTDGMTEAKDGRGRAFDVERLADRLQQWSTSSAAIVVERLAEAAREWAPVATDDISLMAIKRC